MQVIAAEWPPIMPDIGDNSAVLWIVARSISSQKKMTCSEQRPAPFKRTFQTRLLQALKHIRIRSRPGPRALALTTDNTAYAHPRPGCACRR